MGFELVPSLYVSNVSRPILLALPSRFGLASSSVQNCSFDAARSRNIREYSIANIHRFCTLSPYPCASIAQYLLARFAVAFIIQRRLDRPSSLHWLPVLIKVSFLTAAVELITSSSYPRYQPKVVIVYYFVRALLEKLLTSIQSLGKTNKVQIEYPRVV